MSERWSSEEQEKLVLENLGLVYYMVNKLGVAPNNYEDIVSIGTIGLIKAASTFEKSKNIKFATYAARCINNEIFMYFRKENKNANNLLMDDPIANDKDGNEITIGETIEDSSSNFMDTLAERDTIERLFNIILNFPKHREKLIILYMIAGMNQDYIGATLNVSQSYISRLEKKLKNEIESYFTTSQKFKEVYKMAIVGDSYRISFYSKDVKNFNMIFATFLKSLTSTETLPNFKVICSSERIIIQVPAHPESFSFIAQIIQEIDDYSVTFVSDKEPLLTEGNTSKKVKSDESEPSPNMEENATIQEVEEDNVQVSKETIDTEENQIISDNLSTSAEVDKPSLMDTDSTVKRGDHIKQVRVYMLSKDTFTVKELKIHFPNVPVPTINNAIVDAKNRGLITSIRRGEYTVKKD